MVHKVNYLREQLRKYFEQIIKEEKYDDEQNDDFIESCYLSFILDDLIKIKENRTKVICRKLVQEQFNKLMRLEIKKLAKRAQDQNIKLLLLKGVALTDKYYPDEKMRLTTDIDLFVSAEKLYEFMYICKENGYAFADGKIIDKHYIQNYISISANQKYHHIDSIVKYLDTFPIYIDVHISFFLTHWFGEKSNAISEDFYHRSYKSFEKDYINVYQLELHDLIIYQQIHFIQHFYKNVWEGFCIGDFYLQKKINLLFELAIIIVQEYDQISWEYYCALCQRYEISMELALVCRFINEIFGAIVPQKVIEQLICKSKCYQKALFYENFCSYNIKRKLFEILISPVNNQVFEFTQNVFLTKNTYICTHQIDKSFHFRLGGLKGEKDNYICGSEIVANFMNADVWSNWDLEYLHIYVCATCHGISMLKYVQTNKISQNDNIAIILYNNKYDLTAKRISIRFDGRIIENKYEYSDIITEINLKQNILVVSIKWKLLGIKPKLGNVFGFNFEWDHYENTELMYTRLSLSKNSCWHDIIGMIKLELQN